MKFNPNRYGEQISASVELSRQITFGDAEKLNALGGFGSGILRSSIQCLLVGMFEEGRALLPKARTFLDAAIEQREIPRVYTHGATEAECLEQLALCNWLIDGAHDLDNLKAAVKWEEIYFSERTKPEKYGVQHTLAQYLDAEEYATLINRFERTGLKKPTNLRQIQGPGTLCFAIARHRLGFEYDAEEIIAAINTFLKRHVAGWIDRDGRFEDTARWMKLAFWKPGDDPIATLLKAYDYLPGVEPPKYP